MSRCVRLPRSCCSRPCTHSDSYPIGTDYGAIGPLVPGSEASLGGLGADAAWTENGGGILYTGACLSQAQPPPDPIFPTKTIPSILLLPASGGSAFWELCEAEKSVINPPPANPGDSTTTLYGAALGADGRLVYVECVWLWLHGSLHQESLNCANSGVISMWLSDSAAPFTRRRRLFTLYRTSPATTGPVNNLLNVRWVGSAAFIARGYSLAANSDTVFLGLVSGTTGASPSLGIIPNTDRIRLFSPTEGNATLVFNRDSLAVERMPIRGGTITSVATLPALAGRALIDLSCKAELCLLLTQEPSSAGITSTFWTVDLATGAVVSLRSYPIALSGAQLSPGGNGVLVREADGVHLFTDLLP